MCVCLCLEMAPRVAPFRWQRNETGQKLYYKTLLIEYQSCHFFYIENFLLGMVYLVSMMVILNVWWRNFWGYFLYLMFKVIFPFGQSLVFVCTVHSSIESEKTLSLLSVNRLQAHLMNIYLYIYFTLNSYSCIFVYLYICTHFKRNVNVLISLFQYYLFWLQLKALLVNLIYLHLDEHFQVNRLLIKYWR